ncbi:protein Skeletor, isoforms D/E-like [Thrips palmi]|uniref:Protein Skeletor, isoforms D/E-like n=1 Tax=Thrips palmi TaxID=161013 RepID=A0A6P8XYW4_THRPL|nr:protein Skeletor, isoforms D/E-like [Thrips palmi]
MGVGVGAGSAAATGRRPSRPSRRAGASAGARHSATLLSALTVAVLAACWTNGATAQQNGYFGVPLGELTRLHHGVRGNVFAVDARTLHIRDFHYDGEGPAAYFYAGNSKNPGAQGFRIRDERGSASPLKRYRGKHITITLPEGKTLHQLRWFSIWCEEFSVNFGDVRLSKSLELPKPHKIGALSGIHGVSSDPVVVVDAQTLLVPSFSYDGEAPDAKFWVGRGPKPSPQGIRVADENGKEVPLRRYEQKTLVLTLPGDLTVFDIGHFGVWCEAFAVDFGHVQLPRSLSVPPSLRMLGVQPQSKLNCEVLNDDLAYEVRWAVAGDSVVLQLVAKLDDNEYMSFGLSGEPNKSAMVGGDVVVAWVDKNTLKGTAVDYYLDAKSQCSGARGSCPDTRIKDNSNSIRLLNAALVNGYSIVTYQRPLAARDALDKAVLTNGSQPVIWAVGPLNQRGEVSYHSLANRNDIFLEFGRSPRWNCPLPDGGHGAGEDQDREPARPAQTTAVTTRPPATPAPHPKKDAWEIPPIQCHEPEDGVFYAQMGPTGGKHGYPAITGHVGWGISWYINGLLIPEINVVRGKTYTFVVEGGLDAETPARYHPFYITDDPVGGFEHKTAEERASVRIFAGAVQDKRGHIVPTGTGRLCNWTPDPNQPLADEFSSFGAYQRTLTLVCDEGEPGVVQWTPDHNTPNTVYYQCFTHRYLGWKINVLDSCDKGSQGAASEQVSTQVAAPLQVQQDQDLDGKASIQVETRVPAAGNRVSAASSPFGQDIKGLDGLISDEDRVVLLKGIEKFAAVHDKDPFPFDSNKLLAQVQTQSEAAEAVTLPEALTEAQLEAGVESEAQAEAGAGTSASAGLATTLYDHLREETAKQEPQPQGQGQGPSSNPAPSPTDLAATLAQHLPHLQQQQLAGLLGSGHSFPLGLGGLGGLGPSMMHLKYIPHPSLRMPAPGAPGHMAYVARGPPARPLLYTKHGLAPHPGLAKAPHAPHGMMPLSMMHPHRHTLPSHLMRRPVPLMLAQQQRQPLGQAGLLVTSPSQHNYVIKKKPLFRVPAGVGVGVPAGVPAAVAGGVPLLSSSTLRPLYIPTGLQGLQGLHTSTLRPAMQSTLSLQQQLYATTKLQKLAAALSSTTTTTTTTTTPAPIPAPVHHAYQGHQGPLRHHAVQSYPAPAYYRPPSANPYPPVSPAFELDSSPEQTPSASLGPLAINTGFNPGSVVVEGGFKPILQRRQDEAQDRMAFVEGGDDEDDLMEGSVVEMERRSSDVAVEDEEDEDAEQKQRRTETFEPMFIPSPPDRNSFKPGASTTAKKAVEPGKTLKQAKLTKGKQPRRDKPAQLTPIIVRPRPAILRRPLYPNMVVPPFKIQAQARRGHQQLDPLDSEDDDDEEGIEEAPAASKGSAAPKQLQQQQRDEDLEEDDEEAEDETMMAAERMDTYYLPPSAPQQGLPHTIVTYDGKAVDAAIAATIPNPPPDTLRSPSSADLVRAPQFGPFLGEAPPPVPAAPSPLELPQLQQVQPAPLANYPPLPLSAPGDDGQGDGQGDGPLVLLQGQDGQDPLQTDASSQHHAQHAQQSKRERRSPKPHHEPGHEGHDDDDKAGVAPSGAASTRSNIATTLSILCAILVSALR